MARQTAAAGPRAPRSSLARTVLLGTVGSVLMTFGSFGIGWLAPISALRQNPFVIALRYSDWAVVVCIVVTSAGAMALTREWFRLGQKIGEWDARARVWVRRAVLCWMTPLLFAFPLFSRDVYSYFAQGRVYDAGMNPYDSGVSTVNNFFQYGADPLWSEAPPPYGPVFLSIEGLVVRLAGTSPDLAFYLFRAVALVGVALVAVFLPKLARMHGVNPTRATWLCLANPLFLVHFVVAAHNDSLMIGLMVAGIYAAARWRNAAGGVLGTTVVTLGVAVKPMALFALPFVGLLWAGRGASWPRRILCWVLVLGIALAELWGMGVLNGFGFSWVGALSTTGGLLWIWFAPVGVIGFLAHLWAQGLGLDADFVQGLVYKAGQALGVLAAGVVALYGRDAAIVRRLALALAFVVALNPMIQAWYVVWLIPFFAITGIRPDWHVDVYFLLTVFFILWAVSDQLDVFPYLDISVNMGRLVGSAVALVYGLYLMFVDPSTRREFRSRAPAATIV